MKKEIKKFNLLWNGPTEINDVNALVSGLIQIIEKLIEQRDEYVRQQLNTSERDRDPLRFSNSQIDDLNNEVKSIMNRTVFKCFGEPEDE